MANAKNYNNLSKDDICKFYEFVCAFEREYKTKFGCYNINDLEVRKLCEENGIVLGSRPKRNYRFVFEANKPKNKSDNDKAHHLLRHIRNSFCHGLVTKKGRKFTLKDRNKVGNISMEAEIRDDLLWSLLDKIIETQKA